MYNVSLGESLAMEFAGWVDAGTLRVWLEARDPNGDSGDVYARAQPGDSEGAADGTRTG